MKALADGVRAKLNATTVFSFWPEVLKEAGEYGALDAAGCLINDDLSGRAVDPTPAHCRQMIWEKYLKPRYFDEGVSAYWLDETDGEGTGIGDGDHGYDTSFGPAAFASNLWVGDWLRTFSGRWRRRARRRSSRAAWAGGQPRRCALVVRHLASFEQLALVPQGVHALSRASLGGRPTLAGTAAAGLEAGGHPHPNDSPYMRELIVRWYRRLFCPVFRTRLPRRPGPDADTQAGAGSCGYNEVWSYGDEAQARLSRLVKARERLRPYMTEPTNGARRADDAAALVGVPRRHGELRRR